MMKNRSLITEDEIRSVGFRKVEKDNGLVYFSKVIPDTDSEFIILQNEQGIYSAPQIHTPDSITNEMLYSD